MFYNSKTLAIGMILLSEMRIYSRRKQIKRLSVVLTFGLLQKIMQNNNASKIIRMMAVSVLIERGRSYFSFRVIWSEWLIGSTSACFLSSLLSRLHRLLF